MEIYPQNQYHRVCSSVWKPHCGKRLVEEEATRMGDDTLPTWTATTLSLACLVISTSTLAQNQVVLKIIFTNLGTEVEHL